jgi:hypothetical protein
MVFYGFLVFSFVLGLQTVLAMARAQGNITLGVLAQLAESLDHSAQRGPHGRSQNDDQNNEFRIHGQFPQPIKLPSW